MENEKFYSLLLRSDLNFNDIASLENLVNEYPWFDLPRILHLLALKNENHGSSKNMLAEYGIFLHNRKHVFKLLHSNLRDELIAGYEEKKSALTEDATTAKVNSELLDFSYTDPTKHEGDDNNPKFRKEKKDLIDRFLIEEPGPIKADKATNLKGDVSTYSVQENENLLTDTLAKIYVKQGLYSKAIFAYEKLSLKYPEKSVYFASQIEEIKEITNKK